jgi:hypothetical protein
MFDTIFEAPRKCMDKPLRTLESASRRKLYGGPFSAGVELACSDDSVNSS